MTNMHANGSAADSARSVAYRLLQAVHALTSQLATLATKARTRFGAAIVRSVRAAHRFPLECSAIAVRSALGVGVHRFHLLGRELFP